MTTHSLTTAGTVPAMPVLTSGSRTSTDHDGTLTEQMLLASADRVLHAARSCDRPHLDAEDLAVAWQGDRGFFTNVAHPLVEPHDWDDLLARSARRRPGRSADHPRQSVHRA